MDKTETLKIMTVIKTAYPKYYTDSETSNLQAAVRLWNSMFKETDYSVVATAVKAYIATNKFPPTIADINEYIASITKPEEKTAFEAWELVKRAVRNSSYNSETEFNKLPEDIQAVVGSSETLRTWAMSDTSTLDSVIGSNFQRGYKARQQCNRRLVFIKQAPAALTQNQQKKITEEANES